MPMYGTGFSATATEEDRISAMQQSETAWASAAYGGGRRGRPRPYIPSADYHCKRCGEKGIPSMLLPLPALFRSLPAPFRSLLALLSSSFSLLSSPLALPPIASYLHSNFCVHLFLLRAA